MLVTADRPTQLERKVSPGLSVLVVDDNDDCATSQALLLGLWGHQCFIASNGTAALELARTRHPDVILLDLGLPDISGWDVALALPAEPRPFIVAISGHGLDEARQRSAAAGINIHLLKPCDPVQLRAILDEFRKNLCQ